MVQNTSDNRFGTAKWIVDPSLANGTHSTIAAALTSASSGETIFVRPGTYTENLTLKAGVNLAAYDGDALTPNVTIVGKATFTAAGTVSISGIRLQTNSDYFLAVTGSAASLVYLKNCFLLCANNTGISLTSSSASSTITISTSTGDITTTGIALFAHSGAGALTIQNSLFGNSGSSVTANTVSGAGQFYTEFVQISNPITTSGASNPACTISDSWISAPNAIALTVGHTSTVFYLVHAYVQSGSASAISVGTGATLNTTHSTITSGNTNAITGLGTLNYSQLSFNGVSSLINTSTTVQMSNGFPYSVANGGLGAATLASHGILLGNGTGAVTPTAEPTDGQLLIGKTGNFPVLGSVTSSGGTITVTPGAGTLNLDLSATGPLVQYVYTSKTATQDCSTALPVDDTIPAITEGDEVITCAITPKSATNLLVIKFNTFGTVSSAVGAAALFQDATSAALSASAMTSSGAEAWGNMSLNYKMVAGTTSATTFRIRCGNSAGANHFYINGQSTGRVFGGVASTTLEIWEIMA